MADFTLFRGRMMNARVENMGGDAARVTLDCEDYNGLFDRIEVGAPDGISTVTQDDGTDLYIDPAAIASDMIGMLDSYWRRIGRTNMAVAPIATVGPDIDDTYILADAPPGVPVLQWYTDLTNLRAALDDMAAHVSGAVRYWIDPDLRPHWRELIPSEAVIGNGSTGTLPDRASQAFMMLWPSPDPDTIIEAPFSLGPAEVGNVIMPKSTSIDWAYTPVRDRVFVRGSTVPGSGWSLQGQMWSFYGAGEDYIDAPGSIYEEDRLAIIAWHGQKNYRPGVQGSASISPGHDGWRVGQTLVLTDPVLALSLQFGLPAIVNRPFTIQGVTGTLKAGGEPIGVRLRIGSAPLIIEITTMASVQSFNWNETLGEAGRATVVLELLDEEQGQTLPIPQQFVILPQGDIEFYIPDGTSPIIEYDLDFGDIPPGALSRQLAKIPDPPAPAVVYKFIVTVDDPLMPDGGSSRVKAQLADSSEAAVKLAGVPMKWVQPILQFEDNAQTVVGTLYTLVDDVGTTDAAGAVFSTITRSGVPSPPAPGDIYNWRVQAVALPIE